MGIQGYNKFLQSAYRDAFVYGRHQPRRYDHVYIDVNNLLHVAAHHSKSERTFFKKLFALLDSRLARTNPRHTVTLALDGPAPMSKTISQRRRRIRLSAGAATPLSADMSKLLKIGITPGSQLALKIDRALEYYVARRMLRRGQDALLYEISSMRVAGEGEIKLVKSIQQRLANSRFNGHSHCIVTEDSDALLLAMTLFGQGKGAGCASNPEFQVFVLSGNAVFSARLFDALLLSSLPRGASLDSARRDFIGLSAMMGNDYIFGSKLGVKNSWRAYLELRGTYHFRDTSLFLMPPDREPDGRKKKDVPANVKRPKSGVNWHFLKQLARKLIDPKFDKLKVRGVSRLDAKQKVKQVYEYMYGVEWMMEMYFDGECSDFSYFSFTMGPENLDLLLLPEKYAIDCDPFRDQKRAEASFYNRRPITPLAYSLAVIPRGGRAMLSENVRPLVDPGSPIKSLFVHDYCVQCIQHRMHVSPMEHAMQNATLLQHRDPGYNELIATNAQFSQFSRYVDDEGCIIHPSTGDYMSLEEMREELKTLNRAHLTHLATAEQHSPDIYPLCLPTLEATVARRSADSELTDDEEVLRTLATPILLWRSDKFDPSDLDRRDFASENETKDWQSTNVPEGFKKLDLPDMLELRKYDGDVADVIKRWGRGNEFFAEFDRVNKESPQVQELSEFDKRLRRLRRARKSSDGFANRQPQQTKPQTQTQTQTRAKQTSVKVKPNDAKKPPTSTPTKAQSKERAASNDKTRNPPPNGTKSGANINVAAKKPRRKPKRGDETRSSALVSRHRGGIVVSPSLFRLCARVF